MDAIFQRSNPMFDDINKNDITVLSTLGFLTNALKRDHNSWTFFFRIWFQGKCCNEKFECQVLVCRFLTRRRWDLEGHMIVSHVFYNAFIWIFSSLMNRYSWAMKLYHNLTYNYVSCFNIRVGYTIASDNCFKRQLTGHWNYLKEFLRPRFTRRVSLYFAVYVSFETEPTSSFFRKTF